MVTPFKRLNSKRFLLFYLLLAAILLLIGWLRMHVPAPDARVIPPSLAPYLLSPPRPLPQFLLRRPGGRVLTNTDLDGRWTFVYFTHSRCEPDCAPVLAVLRHLRDSIADRDVGFVLIDIDPARPLQAQPGLHDGLELAGGDTAMIDALARQYGFLYLQSADHAPEQQHHVYLTDPKGRAYAVFRPPFTSAALAERYDRIRAYYARTE